MDTKATTKRSPSGARVTGRLLTTFFRLGVALAAVSVPADTHAVRHVAVQSLLGQWYDAVITDDDLETFGLGIPRGTALPRRLYPVRNLGTPMIHGLRDARYREVLLRHPKRNHTEYLDPAVEPETEPGPPPPPARPTLSVQATAGRALEFSWPAEAGDWALETTPSLGLGDAVWEAIPPSLYRISGGRVSFVEEAFSSRARFYRLRQR